MPEKCRYCGKTDGELVVSDYYGTYHEACSKEAGRQAGWRSFQYSKLLHHARSRGYGPR
jgi:hypothetical protein